MPARLASLQQSNNSVFVWVTILAIALVVFLALPALEFSQGLASYTPLHSILEIISISVSVMVFGIAWVTQKFKPSSRILILGVISLGVAALDLTHVLSFPGMPDFIIPSAPDKAINYWLAARFLLAIGLLGVALISSRMDSILLSIPRWGWLLLVALIVVIFNVLFLSYPQYVPETFNQSGLTPFKKIAEYLLISIFLLTATILIIKNKTQEVSKTWLAASAITMAMSEFLFTLYSEFSDIYNLVGHIYKIIAFWFLYRALFVESVQAPFIDALKLQIKLSATIDTLPDILVEVDGKGNHIDIHSRDPSLLIDLPEKLIGKNVSEVMEPEEAKKCMHAIKQAERDGQSKGTRIKLKVRSGIRIFELSIARKKEERGPYTFLILSRDVTKTIEIEQKIIHEAKLNKHLLELQRIVHSGNEHQFLQYAVDLAENLTDSCFACIHFIENLNEKLKLVACSSNTIKQRNAESNEVQDPTTGFAIWQETKASKQPKVINDYLGETSANSSSSFHSDIKRIMSIPVIENGKVKMIVGVANKSDNYNEQDLESLQLLSNTIWTLIKQIWQDATIQRLSTGIDQNPYPVIITDTSGCIQYVNHAFTETTGFSSGESIGKNTIEFSGEENPKHRYKMIWRQLARGESWRGEMVNIRKDGSHYTEYAMIYPVKNKSGKIINYVAHKEDITLKKIAEEKIHQLSHYDQLTGFLKRDKLKEKLQALVDDNFNRQSQITIMWLDLDNFKTFNDSLGHQVGDLILVEVANRLRFELGKNAIISRITGDTFAAVLPSTDEHSATGLTKRILELVQQKITLNSHAFSVSASVGLSIFPNDGHTADRLLMCAETAMYRAKNEGRNTFRFFAQEMQQQSLRSLQLSAALKEALVNGQFHLVYQPQLSLDTNSVIGAEALLRWNHPEWGPISPVEFIPLAEQNGLIVQIGEWVLQQVTQLQRSWLEQGLPEISVAINLSALQFHQPDLVNRLTHIVKQSGVSTENIEIELTEAVALKDPEAAGRTINQLSEAGFKVSIDDFGTGYSSMTYLKRFAVHKLKIDQSFIKDIVTDEDDQAIVTAIIQMAQSLHKTTIAEGVETQEQLEFLKEKGCEEIQGYLYSKPLVKEQFEAFLTTNKSNESIEASIP